MGLLCVQDHAEDRPTMADVVTMLLNQSIQLPSPKQPAFFICTVEKQFTGTSGKESEICSTNDVTISVMEAR